MEIMKYEEPFADSIHKIFMDQFVVHYHTPAQKEIYIQLRKSSYVSA